MLTNNKDCRVVVELFMQHNICGFLKGHGITELNDENPITIALDIFRGHKDIEAYKLYIAIKKHSDMLIGNYNGNPAVKRAELVGVFINAVIKLYNLIIRLYNNNCFDQYRKIMQYVDDADVLYRAIPNNINYYKLVSEITNLYTEGLITLAGELEKTN